jgi:hypothetical protein
VQYPECLTPPRNACGPVRIVNEEKLQKPGLYPLPVQPDEMCQPVCDLVVGVHPGFGIHGHTERRLGAGDCGSDPMA